MRIKTMTPAMIAALFPPKPKPEEAWRRDVPAEPADLPRPAPPEPQPQAPRVSLVDILRDKHAEEQPAATALNAIRLGRTPPPGGLFGIRAEPAPADMEANHFGVRSSGLSIPPTGFNVQQSLRTDPVRAALPSFEQSSFAQPNFGNIRQEERYPVEFPPPGFPFPPRRDPSNFPPFWPSQRDQFPVVMHAQAPAGGDIEPDRDRERASGPARTQPPTSGSAPATFDRPQQISAPLPASVDPKFVADHEDFHRLIGDGRLDPAEHQRIGTIIDRVNAYRLGSQRGPIGPDAHQTAASDLSRTAGKLAQDSPRVAAPLAAYAMVHADAARRNSNTAGGWQDYDRPGVPPSRQNDFPRGAEVRTVDSFPTSPTGDRFGPETMTNALQDGVYRPGDAAQFTIGRATGIPAKEPSSGYFKVLRFTKYHAPASINIARKFDSDVAEGAFTSHGEEYRTHNRVHGYDIPRDTLADPLGLLRASGDVPHIYPSVSAALEAYYQDDRKKIESGRPWQGKNSRFIDIAKKIIDPMRLDIGGGNINLGTAISLLKKYNADPQNRGKGDLFELNRFEGNLESFYHQLLNRDSRTSLYIAALKIADVKEFYLHAERYGGPGWKVKPETARALRNAYLRSSGAQRAELLNAGYKMAYSTLVAQASKKEPRFGPVPRVGWNNYFRDGRSPYKGQIAILRGKPI